MVNVKKILSSGFYFILVAISRILRKWIKAEVIEVFPSINNYRVKLPKNIDEISPSFAKFFITVKNFPSHKIFLLKNVNVIGAGVVFKNLRIFHPSLAWDRDYFAFRHGSILVKQWSNKTSVVSGNVALVYNVWASENYYHWMMDSLPRILLLNKNYPDVTLILPAAFPDYMKKSLEVLGSNKYVFIKPLQVVKVPYLIFPELTSNVEYQHPILIKELRELFFNKYQINQVKPHRFIYISRNRQSKRKILNEDDLIILLEKYGFDTLFFEELDFDGQVKLMSHTKVLLSLHGANLTNMFFMPKFSTVIELMNKDFNNRTYFNLSSVLNLSYYCVPCEALEDETVKDDYLRKNNASIFVDIINVEKVLIQIFTS